VGKRFRDLGLLHILPDKQAATINIVGIRHGCSPPNQRLLGKHLVLVPELYPVQGGLWKQAIADLNADFRKA
jgi:hypothetical protein